MAKVHHVKRAYKNYMRHGIRRGSEYWWWSSRRKTSGGIVSTKHFSKVPPKQSQLTASSYKRAYWLLVEQLDKDVSNSLGNIGAASEVLSVAADHFASLMHEQRDKLDNMPQHLQQSPSAELLRSRFEQCQSVVDSLTDNSRRIDELDVLDCTPEEVMGRLSDAMSEIPQPE